MDTDGDGKITPNVDRTYCLNPWPCLPRLRYQFKLGNSSASTIKNGSQGRSSVQYVETTTGRVRVDSFVILPAEIGQQTGDKVRFGYYGSSPKPEQTLNPIGYIQEGTYYSFAMPWAKFYELTVADRPATLDFKKIPDGRDRQMAEDDKPPEPKP